MRRAFLSGYDKPTKTDFSHRRQWIVDRMMNLCDIFSINICSYAVMSNHYHMVLKVEENKLWTKTQTLKAWNKLYSLPYLCEKYLRGEITDYADKRQVKKMTKKYRKRLMSISLVYEVLKRVYCS